MGRPKAFIREEVIENALLVFWTKGYAATSLSDLVDITGLNKKSLYNEFGSKHELFKVVLDKYGQKKSHQVKILTKEPLGKKNVINYLNDLADSVDPKGCLLSLSISERDLLEKDVKNDVKKKFKGLQVLIYENLKNEYSEQKANSLSLLISSMMFSTASLGKLRVDKKEIKLMIKELVSVL